MDKTLEVVGRNTGISTDQIKEMKDTLAEVNTRGSAATNTILTFARSGLIAETDFKKFVGTVKDFAAGAGVSSDQAIQQFTQSIIRLQPELLSTYGIELNLNQVYTEAAEALGKTATELEANEKRQALLNEVYRQGASVVGVYAETYDTAGKNVLSIQDRLRELWEFIGTILNPAFREFTGVVQSSLKEFVESIRTNEEGIKIWGETFRGIAVQIIESFKSIVSFIGENKEILIGIFVALGLGLAVLGVAFVAAHIVAIAVFTGIVALVTVLAKAWNSNFLNIKDITETVFAWLRDTAWPIVQTVFGFIGRQIKDTAQLWIERFNAIKGAVESVIGAIQRVISAAQEMSNKVKGGLKIPGFQSGGVVPGPVGAPQMAVVHGGEEVIPVDRARAGGGGGSGGMAFTVNIGIYAGSEIEKRNIARELYASLVQLANAQNRTVSEMMGA